jgi:hypothetical protein
MMTLDPKNTLSPIDPHHHNRSTSSLLSEAATFHSAVAAPETEMEPSKHAQTVTCPTPPPLEHIATQMARIDSGYEAGGRQLLQDKDKDADKRRSTSLSSSQRSRRKRHSVSSTTSSTHTQTRPTTKRASRSTPASSIHRVSTRSTRPGLQTRYTTPHPRTPLLTFDNGDGNMIPTYTFFQFPQFPSVGTSPPSTACVNPLSGANSEDEIHTPPPPPPATIHYFLLPETRRLEYAAIDAASRGVRGFVTKMIPDCILPVEYRRRKFCSGDADSDVGSVRRYRIPLTGEKPCDDEDGEATPETSARKRSGLWKRLTGFGKA